MKEIIPRQNNQLDLLEFVCSICISQPSLEKQNWEDIQRYTDRDLLWGVCSCDYGGSEAHYLPSASWRPRKAKDEAPVQTERPESQGSQYKTQSDSTEGQERSMIRPSPNLKEDPRSEAPRSESRRWLSGSSRKVYFHIFVLFRPLMDQSLSCTGSLHWGGPYSSLSLQIQMPVSTRNTLTNAPGNHIFQLSGSLSPVKWT